MGSERLLPRVFFNTGDLILREETSQYIEDTRAHWDALGAPYEMLTPDEVAYRWPWIRFENLGVAVHEPAAGVVRARRAIESVARVFEEEGGTIRIGRASLGDRSGATLHSVAVEGGDPLSGAITIFACGPWLPKVFPELMGNRLRISMGHVFYFAVPPGDTRFSFPNMPSYGVPGCTGWPALPADHRGFRVRTGGRPPEDPDNSDRWIPTEYHERPRQILDLYFPDLAGAPINETRACHYESSVDRNFIVDHHPDFENVWLIGGGSSEGFKFGPVLGEYIAGRVMDVDDEPELVDGFRLNEEEFGASGRSRPE
jgi:glycine/D-amino acid oxidase-like deaminating enzyme